MSRTYRNLSFSLARYPFSLSERREYYTAIEQVVPVMIRASQRGTRLRFSAGGVPISSNKEKIRIERWLITKLGRSWNKILSEAARMSTLKSNPANFQLAKIDLKMYVQTQTFLVGNRVWCYLNGGYSVPIERFGGFYVHPETRTLRNTYAKKLEYR